MEKDEQLNILGHPSSRDGFRRFFEPWSSMMPKIRAICGKIAPKSAENFPAPAFWWHRFEASRAEGDQSGWDWGEVSNVLNNDVFTNQYVT